jgi:23S rRNA (guanosine2251-2'-O)-methyltransferase
MPAIIPSRKKDSSFSIDDSPFPSRLCEMRRPLSTPPREARRNPHAGTDTSLPFLSWEHLLELIQEKEDALVLILDGVQDPHNLGACLRSAAGAGVLAVVAPKNRASPLTDTARRVACGGAEEVPFIQVTNLARSLRELQKAGLWLVGTSDQSETMFFNIDLKGRIGIVLGAEGDGMRRLTTETCDFLGRIPMAPGKVACLNVSVTAGVCLFEAIRQRTSG